MDGMSNGSSYHSPGYVILCSYFPLILSQWFFISSVLLVVDDHLASRSVSFFNCCYLFLLNFIFPATYIPARSLTEKPPLPPSTRHLLARQRTLGNLVFLPSTERTKKRKKRRKESQETAGGHPVVTGPNEHFLLLETVVDFIQLYLTRGALVSIRPECCGSHARHAVCF